MYYGAKICQCVCVFGLQMSYCSLLYALMMETIGPYAPIHLPALIPGMLNLKLVVSHIRSPTWHLGLKYLDKI